MKRSVRFAEGRQLLLNGVEMPCDSQNWASLSEPVNRGYSVEVTPGDFISNCRSGCARSRASAARARAGVGLAFG